WHNDSFPTGEHGCTGSGFGIAGAQVLRVLGSFTVEQGLGIAGGEPAAFLADPDGDNVVLAFIDGVDHGCGGKQRYFMLSATPAEQDSDPQFRHDISV